MQRLRTRSQFRAVLAGDKVAATAHFALHRCPLDRVAPRPNRAAAGFEAHAPTVAQSDVWLGAMVPKRWAKRAVTRNSIKRQIYDVSSEFESVLPKAAHVVRLRSGFDRSRFISASSVALKSAIRAELVQLLSGAIQEDVKVVENMVTGDFLGSFTIIPRVQLGLRIPVTWLKGVGITPDGHDEPAGINAVGRTTKAASMDRAV